MQDNFEDIYNKITSEIKQEELEELKNERKKIILKNVIIVLIICFLVILEAIISKSALLLVAALPLLIILLIIFTIMSLPKYQEVKNNFFKQKIVSRLIKYYNDTFSYSPNIGISSEEYNKVWNEKYNIYKSEDYIRGSLKNNCKLEMSDVQTELINYSPEGEEQRETIFSGIFAKIDLPSNFIDEIYIYDKSSNIINEKESLKMDSSKFESNFNVYTSNRMTAFQLLTLDIMQTLIEYKEESKIKFEICIKENSLYIRYWTGDTFEVGMFNEVTSHDTIQKYYKILEFSVKLSEKLSDIIIEM